MGYSPETRASWTPEARARHDKKAREDYEKWKSSKGKHKIPLTYSRPLETSRIHSGHRVINPKVVPLAKATPMGVPWAAVGQAALHLGKAIYKHPKVQDKWKKFKTKHKLEWLPFGKKPQPRRSVMGRVNKHKYKKGTVQA